MRGEREIARGAGFVYVVRHRGRGRTLAIFKEVVNESESSGLIGKIVRSMPKRMKAVIANNGGPIDY